MTDAQNRQEEGLWAELYNWFGANCSRVGLALQRLSPASFALLRNGDRMVKVDFYPNARRQLVYELRDGTLRELQILSDANGAVFRSDRINYSAPTLAGKILNEIVASGT
jgi:hypothetical protein